MKKVTESESLHDNLEQLSTIELLTGINQEDQKVALAVQKELDSIEKFVDNCYARMSQGGRLFYIGAGTSGRLGIVDASECPPTFGVEFGRVVGIMAGGDQAIRKAVEFAEDDKEQGWKDLLAFEINANDTVVGIAASGTTPYVLHALKQANAHGVLTGSVTCNPGNPIAEEAQFPMTIEVGPEFVTGSTRMKSGTAQKLVLNMISTSLMIKLGHVKGNRMVDMQLTNEKLVDRGTQMILNKIPSLSYDEAQQHLLEKGSVRAVLNHFQVQ